MKGFYKQIIEQLRQHGYSHHGPGKGSHEIWTNGRHYQTVPHNCLSRHTANAIMKQAGIAFRF